MRRSVLEGFAKIGYHVHLCPFPGSLFAYLQYTGDPCDYDYIMGVSGAAFRRFWEKDDGGNIDLMYLAPGPYKRVLDALGYEYTVIPPENKAAMVGALKESIASGRPVLAFGIIGPPECGVVTGYDNDGETAIGYSYFQDPSIEGYYEQPDWVTTSSWSVGLLCIGEKSKPQPTEREILVPSLKWAIDLARTPVRPERPNHLSGLAAYEGWAGGLEVDEDYPGDDLQALFWRVMVHGDQCVMVEERREAATYLRRMSGFAPEVADELNAAASFYDKTLEHMGKLWPWASYQYEDREVQKSLADPEVRRGIAEGVRAAHREETSAVEHLEAALATLNAEC